jgi:hypothetical protein
MATNRPLWGHMSQYARLLRPNVNPLRLVPGTRPLAYTLLCTETSAGPRQSALHACDVNLF